MLASCSSQRTSSKVPSHKILAAFTVSTWLQSEQVEMILRSLGLYNAKDTIVGNNALRGVSGGERRRVTLGESARSYAAKVGP